MKRFLSAAPVALMLALVVGSSARANMLDPGSVEWTYDFATVAPGTNNGLAAVFADGNPGAGVTFTNEASKTAKGSSSIVATNLRVFSASPAGSPDVLIVNGDYGLALNLSMNGGADTATLNFTGKLTGTFSGDNSDLSNAFGPNSTQTASVAGYNFTVALLYYTPPGPPNQTNAGSIGAYVTVSKLTPGGVVETPEPGTMLLSGLGMTLLGGVAWKKRRQGRLAV